MVELLVVLAIFGIVLSLVGPFTINQLDNVKRAQEREEIRMVLNEWQFRAFSQRRAIELEFSGRRLVANRVNSIYEAEAETQLATYEFEFSQFPTQRIVINSHGYAEQTELSLRQGEREFTLNVTNIGREAQANAFN